QLHPAKLRRLLQFAESDLEIGDRALVKHVELSLRVIHREMGDPRLGPLDPEAAHGPASPDSRGERREPLRLATHAVPGHRRRRAAEAMRLRRGAEAIPRGPGPRVTRAPG